MVELKRHLNVEGNFPSCGDRAWRRLRVVKQEGTVVIIRCRAAKFSECGGCIYRGGNSKVDLQAVRSTALPSDRHDRDGRSEYDGIQSADE